MAKSKAIGGYKIVSLNNKRHNMLVKQPSSTDNEDASRTLIIRQIPCGIPISNLQSTFQSVFAPCGQIASLNVVNLSGQVLYSSDPNAGSEQSIRYTASDCIAVLQFDSDLAGDALDQCNDSAVDWNQVFIKDMRSEYIKQYRQQHIMANDDIEEYELQLTECMEQYDERERVREQEEIAKANQPDEDGWIKVTRHGGSGKKSLDMTTDGDNSDMGELVQRQLKQKMNKRKLQEPEVLKNFYKFQKVKEKTDKLRELAAGFKKYNNNYNRGGHDNRRFNPL
ncbi:hypothetical protein MP228_008107 [Amoeboaphelidium protococcarum]|nr:hypothetical protein MP228_008107 [Amoeboaphelidium protococcarum]